jgi:hypothetical protein
MAWVLLTGLRLDLLSQTRVGGLLLTQYFPTPTLAQQG